MNAEQAAVPQKSHNSFGRRVAWRFGFVLLIYLIGAYVLAPVFWRLYAHRHPTLEGIPGITYTKLGIPGDPINVAMIGTREELMHIMKSARWIPADPLSLRSDLEIAESSVLERPDPDAPASNLYLFDRKQDLVFEQPVGNSPRQRHHVRFWETAKTSDDGRPIWVGAATYDERVGLSRRTGQITHVTAPDVDAERDYLIKCLRQTNELASDYVIQGFHAVREGKNGGGDPWTTDGNLVVGVVKTDLTLSSP